MEANLTLEIKLSKHVDKIFKKYIISGIYTLKHQTVDYTLRI